MATACDIAEYADQGDTIEQPPSTSRALGGESPIVAMLIDASERTGVPAELLAAIAFTESRFRHVEASHSADDAHHQPGRHGLFVLSDADVIAGASLTSTRRADIIAEPRANALAAAALLASAAGEDTPKRLGDWHLALSARGGAHFADSVMGHLARGLRGADAAGNAITVTARPELAGYAADDAVSYVATNGYPGAVWNPAHSSNYSSSSRGAADIDYLVIHTTQGSYSGAISWFKNSTSNVSAHYVVRSSDGEVTQMVDDSDIAWHDACFNSPTIGIEHEGFVDDPSTWYTEAMYIESAKLAAHLAREYSIPIDRDHFFGHGDAPDCSSHTDPGSGWDWDHYLSLVAADGEATFDASFADQSFPNEMTSGDEAVVWFDFDNLSNVTWGLDETRLGTAEPTDRSSAFFVEGNWLAENRATGADHSSYTPGTTGRFTFLIAAPQVDEPTTFTESFQLVQEGVTWFGPVVTATVRVVPDGWTDADVPDDPDPDAPSDERDPAAGCQTSAGGGSGGCAILLFVALFLGTNRSRRLTPRR